MTEQFLWHSPPQFLDLQMLVLFTEPATAMLRPRLSCLAFNVFSPQWLPIDSSPWITLPNSRLEDPIVSSTTKISPTVLLTPSFLQLAPPSESPFPQVALPANHLLQAKPTSHTFKRPTTDQAPPCCSDDGLSHSSHSWL